MFGMDYLLGRFLSISSKPSHVSLLFQKPPHFKVSSLFNNVVNVVFMLFLSWLVMVMFEFPFPQTFKTDLLF